MTYDVLVRHDPGGHYKATVLGWPDCTAEGLTRQEAIQRAHQALAGLLAEAEIVRIEIEPPRVVPTLTQFAGMWAADDTFDEFKAAMETYRQTVDADEAQS